MATGVACTRRRNLETMCEAAALRDSNLQSASTKRIAHVLQKCV